MGKPRGMRAVRKLRQHMMKRRLPYKKCHLGNEWRKPSSTYIDVKQLKSCIKNRKNNAAFVPNDGCSNNIVRKTASEENDKVLIPPMREIDGRRFKDVKVQGVWIRAFVKVKKEKPSS